MTEMQALRRHHGWSARIGHAKARTPAVRGRSFRICVSYPRRRVSWRRSRGETERVVSLLTARLHPADGPPVGLPPGDGSPRVNPAGGRPAESRPSARSVGEDGQGTAARDLPPAAVLFEVCVARPVEAGIAAARNV